MSKTRQEQVAREDLLLFVNAARAATGQDEFYETAEEAALYLDYLHSYLRIGYRRLYAQSLALGLNDFNTARIVEELLASGAPEQHRAEEGALIRAALQSLPPQRVLALFGRLRKRKVNNRRTRAAIRAWTSGRPDPVFDAVKYRRKLKAAVCHAHVRLPEGVGRFLFHPEKTRAFDHPLLEAARKARYSAEAIYDLPYTSAEGYAAHHKVPRERFLARIAENMTRTERQRGQRTAAAAGVKIDQDWTRAAPTDLVRYALSLQEGPELDGLEAALPEAARRAAHTWGLGRVALVIDRSWSMGSSREKRHHPLAVALAAEALLRAGSASLSVHWTSPAPRALRAFPSGQTDLATPILDALETRPDLLLIVSDGVDTDPPGGAEAVIKGWRHLDPTSRIRIVHLNPVYDSGSLGPRPLSPLVPTVGLRTAEEIPLALALTHVEGDVERWLAPWVARFLEGR